MLLFAPLNNIDINTRPGTRSGADMFYLNYLGAKKNKENQTKQAQLGVPHSEIQVELD